MLEKSNVRGTHVFSFITTKKEVIFTTSALTFDDLYIWRRRMKLYMGENAKLYTIRLV